MRYNTHWNKCGDHATYVSAYIRIYTYTYTCPWQLRPHLSFQPSTFPLHNLWHAIRPNITLRKKSPTLFPFSHLFAFLNYLTGSNIPYQRSKIHRVTDGRRDSESTTLTHRMLKLFNRTATIITTFYPRVRKTSPWESLAKSHAYNLRETLGRRLANA